MTLKEAWLHSPGPRTTREHCNLALKGFCMGSADIIPGVSGGTMAFITGIYPQLINAISSVDATFIRRLLRLDFSGAISGVHARFLVTLLIGIGAAILTMARVIHGLMGSHPIQVWSLFFGLIAASILVVGKHIDRVTPANTAFILAGTTASYLIVGMIPVTTPDTWWFVILCGMIAICAMILPGISGAFLLLVLGKYEFVTGALKNPVLPENFTILLLFALGCIVGLAAFSRILHFCLRYHYAATLSVLTGFMIGAMRKVWPWKEVLLTKVIRGKTHVLETANILPKQFDSEFYWAIGLMLTGFSLVLLLDRFSETRFR